MKITLASTSHIRRALLTCAGVNFETVSRGFDEEPLKTELKERRADPEHIARALATGKASDMAQQTEGFVIGCAQVLALGDEMF